MSKFLSPESEQAVLSRLSEPGNEEIEESNQEVELESSSEQEDVYEDSSTSQNDDDYEDSSPSAEESGHNVPYSRFKEVVHARNTLRDTEAELRAEIEELQSLISAPDDNDDYEEYEATDEVGEYDWVDDDGEAAAPYDDSRMASIEDRIYQFEVQKAEYDIQREIKQSQKHYPNVPEEILLQAVIQNPEVEILDIAEQYNTFVSGIEQQAVASYQQEHKLAAPPRPSSSGRTRGEFKDIKQPRTMDDARHAALKYLKSI